MKFPDLVETVIEEQPHPLLFATMSGAHLYGFASDDSDFDIRGCHVLPAREVIGLKKGKDTIEYSGFRDGLELDIVTHDAEKFFELMLKKNGYVLEQIFSPLVLRGNEHHERLKEIAKLCITKNHSHHYIGFARGQWKLFSKEDPPRVKPLLYTFRVILTGIHLMRSGVVEANLGILNDEYKLPFIGELMDMKRNGPEKGTIENANVEFFKSEFDRLMIKLEEASKESSLPDSPSARDALHDFLLDLRLRNPLSE